LLKIRVLVLKKRLQCSVSESDIRVVFERDNYKSISKDLMVGFELKLVNDKIQKALN
jgi:hypothetical protein